MWVAGDLTGNPHGPSEETTLEPVKAVHDWNPGIWKGGAWGSSSRSSSATQGVSGQPRLLTWDGGRGFRDRDYLWEFEKADMIYLTDWKVEKQGNSRHVEIHRKRNPSMRNSVEKSAKTRITEGSGVGTHVLRRWTCIKNGSQDMFREPKKFPD